ncbi:MAG: hypothetical protein ACXVAX_10230 [Pseudobdellovibrio sp.]
MNFSKLGFILLLSLTSGFVCNSAQAYDVQKQMDSLGLTLGKKIPFSEACGLHASPREPHENFRGIQTANCISDDKAISELEVQYYEGQITLVTIRFSKGYQPDTKEINFPENFKFSDEMMSVVVGRVVQGNISTDGKKINADNLGAAEVILNSDTNDVSLIYFASCKSIQLSEAIFGRACKAGLEKVKGRK